MTVLILQHDDLKERKAFVKKTKTTERKSKNKNYLCKIPNNVTADITYVLIS